MGAKRLNEHDSKGAEMFAALVMAGVHAKVDSSQRHVYLCARPCWHSRQCNSRHIGKSSNTTISEGHSIMLT